MSHLALEADIGASHDGQTSRTGGGAFESLAGGGAFAGPEAGTSVEGAGSAAGRPFWGAGAWVPTGPLGTSSSRSRVTFTDSGTRL